MKTIQAIVYTFEELSDKAKQTAINEFIATVSPEEFGYDIDTIIDNTLEELNKIGINADKSDMRWDTEYYYFGIRASGNYFSDAVEPVIENFISTHHGLTEIEWFPAVNSFRTHCRRSYLDKEMIDVTLWDENCGESSDKYSPEIPTLKEKILDAMNNKFIKIMEILDQAEADMKSDEEYRFSDEYATVYFEEMDVLFNAYGQRINVDVLQPVQDEVTA